MASELRVTTIANNAGTESVGSTYVINGSAKAWMNEHHASVNDSFNVSSVTDGGTGDSVMNFTSNMNNANYYSGGGGFESNIGTNSGYMAYQASQFDTGNKSTSACNPRKGYYTTSGGFGDYRSNTVVIGDLA